MRESFIEIEQFNSLSPGHSLSRESSSNFEFNGKNRLRIGQEIAEIFKIFLKIIERKKTKKQKCGRVVP